MCYWLTYIRTSNSKGNVGGKWIFSPLKGLCPLGTIWLPARHKFGFFFFLFLEEQKWSGMQVTDLVFGGFQGQSAKELSLSPTTLFSLNPSGTAATARVLGVQ